MAKAKRTRTTAPAAAAEQNHEIGTEQLIDEGEVTEQDAIAELRGMGASSEYKFTVSRSAGRDGKAGGYCATYGVGELSLDAIREQFGGGKYAIRVTEASGRYVTNRTVEIVDLPKANAPAIIAAAPAVPTDMQGLAAVIAAMKPAAGGGQDMTQLLIAMMKSQTDQMLALMNRPQPAAPSLSDLLALINASKPKSEDSSVDLLLKGLELGRSLDGGQSSMMDVAREGLGLLGPLIQQQQAAPPRARAIPALPSPVAADGHGTNEAAAVRVTNPATNQENAMLQQLAWLRQQLNALIAQASRQKNPELYAEVMLDNLPPYITPEIILERMSAENAIDQLAMLDGRVNQFRPWFEEFRKAVADLLTDTGEEEDEGEGEEEAPAGG